MKFHFQNGMAEWRIIFIIGATVYIASGIVFCIFGSGDIQPWNNIAEDEVKKESHESQGHENQAFDQSETTDVKRPVNGTQPDVTEITKV